MVGSDVKLTSVLRHPVEIHEECCKAETHHKRFLPVYCSRQQQHTDPVEGSAVGFCRTAALASAADVNCSEAGLENFISKQFQAVDDKGQCK